MMLSDLNSRASSPFLGDDAVTFNTHRPSQETMLDIGEFNLKIY